MAMDRDNVIRKIQALLKLADGTDVEGEMDTALRMAHKLLQKYDLDMNDVQIKREVDDLTTENSEDFTRTYAWMWHVSKAIDILCNTKHFRSGRGWKFRMHFCGTKTDVITALSMFRFLHNTIQDMGKKARFPGIKERNSYCNGVGYRVWQRVTENNQQEKLEAPYEEHERTTAIVLVKDHAVTHYLKEHHNIKNLKPTTVSKDHSAFMRGMRDGNRVPLSISKALPL